MIVDKIYSVRLHIFEDVPSFECHTYFVKKYNNRQKLYFCKYGNEKIYESMIGNKLGHTWYFTNEKERDEAKKEMLENYLESIERQLDDNMKHYEKRMKELKTTQIYYDLRFGDKNEKTS